MNKTVEKLLISFNNSVRLNSLQAEGPAVYGLTTESCSTSKIKTFFV